MTNETKTYAITEEQIESFFTMSDHSAKQMLQSLPLITGEPVAWMRPCTEGCDSNFRDDSTVEMCTGNPWTGWIPLYTHPQPLTPITDDDVTDEMLTVYLADDGDGIHFQDLHRDLIAAAKQSCANTINAWIKHKGDTK